MASDQVQLVQMPDRGPARDPEWRILWVLHPHLGVDVVDVQVIVGSWLLVNGAQTSFPNTVASFVAVGKIFWFSKIISSQVYLSV